MASKFAVAAGGNWSADATWSTTSGGAPDTTAPTAADDVFLDATSGNVTVDSGGTRLARSVNCTGYTGTLTVNAAWTIGDATAGAGNIALKLVAGMTVTWTSGTITFASSSSTQQTVTWAGKSPIAVAVSGANYAFTDAFSSASNVNWSAAVASSVLDLSACGTFACTVFNITGNVAKTLTLGNVAITVSAITGWTNSSTTATTVTANTATVTLTAAGGEFSTTGIAKDYNGLTVVFTGGGTCLLPTFACTFGAVTYTGTAAKTCILQLQAATTITGALTLTSNSAVNRIFVKSSADGTARTLSAGSISITNGADFSDITAAGAANWNLSAASGGSGDALGNTGITFTTSTAQTYTAAGAGSWSNVANWTSRVPLPQDDVLVGAGAGGTVTQDMVRMGRNIDFTGCTRTVSFTVAVGANTQYIFGNLTLGSGMDTSSAATNITFAGRGSHTITSNGKTIVVGAARSVTVGLVAGIAGTYTLADAFAVSGGTTATQTVLVNAALNLSTFTATITPTSGTVSGLIVAAGATLTADATTPGTVALAGTGAATILSVSASATVTNRPNVAITTASANTRTIAGGGKTYGNLTYTVAGSTGALVITGANTFANVNFSDVTNARTLTFTSGTTTTITGLFNVVGTSGKLMTINSSTPGSAATLAKTGAIVNTVDYVNVVDSTATPGSTWYAGANSTDGTGNTGWIFTVAPASNTGATMQLMGV